MKIQKTLAFIVKVCKNISIDIDGSEFDFMKKMMILAAALVLSVGAAVSCGSKDGSSSEKASADASGTISAAEADGTTEKASLPTMNLEAIDKMGEKASELKKGGFITCEKEAEETLRACIDSMFCSGAEETLKYLYPEAVYNAVVNGEAKDNFAAQGDPNAEVMNFHIKKCVYLAPDTGYELAEKYFVMTAESSGLSDYSAAVSKGYSMEISFEVSLDGEKDSVSENVVLVNVEGEGWKVIPLSIEQLNEAVG